MGYWILTAYPLEVGDFGGDGNRVSTPGPYLRNERRPDRMIEASEATNPAAPTGRTT
jgi:hypothetical protein